MNEIEKAIKVLEDLAQCNYVSTREAAQVALTAIKEKLDRSNGCEFCRRFDFSTASAIIESEKFANIYLAVGSYRFPKNEQFNFCPICGHPLN